MPVPSCRNLKAYLYEKVCTDSIPPPPLRQYDLAAHLPLDHPHRKHGGGQTCLPKHACLLPTKALAILTATAKSLLCAVSLRRVKCSITAFNLPLRPIYNTITRNMSKLMPPL